MSFIIFPGVITPPLTPGAVPYGTGSNVLMSAQGTAGQVLISGGGAPPTWTSTIPGTITPPLTAGGIAYGTGITAAVSAAGTVGQPLLSGGSGAPVFGNLPQIAQGNSNVSVSDTGSNGTITFDTDGNERMRITNAGQVLVGATTARSDFFNTTTVIPAFQVELAASNNLNRFISVTSNNSDTGGANLFLAKSRGTTVGAVTIVQNDDQIGAVSFQGADGVDMVEGARIEAKVDGTPGSNDMPGRLAFYTTADGSASSTERARITSAGTLLVGTTSTTANGGVLQVSNGITFPATAVGCSDVNTLDDYEEGTWTPSDASGAGLTLAITGTPNYVKIGSICTVTAFVTYPSTANASAASIGGLPFTIKNIGNSQGATVANTDRGIAITAIGVGNTTQINFTDFSDVNQTNANFSTKFLRFSFTYITS